MNKGYIVPTILIVLLLILAGFFVFIPSVSSPTAEPVAEKSVATSTTEVQEVIPSEEESTATTTSDEIPLDTATTSDTI